MNVPHSGRIVGWWLLLLAVVLLFVLGAPAIVCLAGAIALAVLWCWELESDVRTPAAARLKNY